MDIVILEKQLNRLLQNQVLYFKERPLINKIPIMLKEFAVSQ